MKPPPFQMKDLMRSTITGSVQFSPPLCAVSAPPTLMMTSMSLRKSSSFLMSSNEMKRTSNGEPESASITPA